MTLIEKKLKQNITNLKSKQVLVLKSAGSLTPGVVWWCNTNKFLKIDIKL